MDRTLAASAPAGRRGSSSRRTSAQSGVLGGAAGLASRAGGRFAGFRAALAGRRRLRIALLCALVVVPLLGGAWLWLRHSSFVAVEHVRVSGVHGAQAGAIETALTEAAKRQSTLAADPAALKAAVERYPQVAAVHVQASFPHAMRITVVERRAVAALLVGGTKIAIGSDGIALGTAAATASLPTVGDDVAPTSGGRDGNPLVLQALRVLGAAPAKIDPLVARAYFSPRGLTLAMKNGLLVYFGDATRPHAKWMALAAVLADQSSSGAVYVDVRTPERAAEGFAPGQAPATAETAGSGNEVQIGKGESTVSALAAGLAAATPEGRAQSAAKSQEESSEAASSTSGSASATEAGEAEETTTSSGEGQGG
jgi:cell division protein FtsQ